MIKGLNNLHLTDVTKTTSCNHEYQLTTIFEWVEWLSQFILVFILEIKGCPIEKWCQISQWVQIICEVYED